MGSALAVCLAGFGALVAFWTLQPAPARLPGLFDFASATWGDGVALPLMTGALAYAIRELPAARCDARFAAVAGLLGGAIGVATQVSWLSADTPRLNWTLPRPHHFTAAGWYHAAFLVAMCAVTAALWALALHRLAHTGRLRRSVAVALVTAVAGGASFVALLAVDARAAVATDPRLGLLTALGALTAVSATAASTAAHRRRPRRPAVRRRPRP